MALIYSHYNHYLLSAVDKDHIKKLNDDEKYEESEKLIRFHNQNKIEAFKFDLLKNTDYTLSEKNAVLFTLNHIFRYFDEIQDWDEFFYDDVGAVECDFKQVMHRFIFKTSDIDEQIIDDVYIALLEFFKFLTKRGVIDGYESIENEMLDLKEELIEKMEKYNEVRHNSDYTEEEKEDIREELFEGDHCLF